VLDASEASRSQHNQVSELEEVTHGAAQSEITPVLMATMPNSNRSDTR
jgi:hypothetical protein